MNKYEGDGVPTHPMTLEWGPIGLPRPIEERLFAISPEGSIQFAPLLETIIRTLQRNLESYASVSVGDEGDVSLEHKSGMLRRIVHEPQMQSLVPIVLSYLDEEFSWRDRCRWREAAKYYGTPLFGAVSSLVHDGSNTDIHIVPHHLFEAEESEKMEEWRFRVNGTIFGSLIDSLEEMGYTQRTDSNDTSGIWFGKPGSYDRYKLTSSRIPGTTRLSFGLKLYDVHRDDRRPPVTTIQAQLDPLCEDELTSDRRTGKDVNRRQQIAQRIVDMANGNKGVTASDMLSTVTELHKADQLTVLPESLPKLAHTMVRMSRMATGFLFGDYLGRRFYPLPVIYNSFNDRMIDNASQKRIQARLKAENGLSSSINGTQHAELVKDVAVLGPFYGPYFYRSLFAMGGAAIFGGSPDYEPDWSERALAADTRAHMRLEQLYGDHEQALMEGGPGAFAAAREIASFATRVAWDQLDQAGVVRDNSHRSLFRRMQNLTNISIL